MLTEIELLLKHISKLNLRIQSPVIFCMMKNLLLILLLIATNAYSQRNIQVLDSNKFLLKEGVVLSKTSFRGLSVVDDNTIWVSGSRGTFARSTDGGKTVVYQQLKGYEKSDFRDIEAFDDKRAIMMSSGTPALMLKTIDGGETWKEVFRKDDSAYFLDAMDFWDEKRGMLVGDPINGRFVLLETKDGGETWIELDSNRTPKAYDGEAVFAASGTSLRCVSQLGNLFFAFVTGGSKSRWLEFSNFLGSFNLCRDIVTKMPSGAASKGAFSFIYSKQQRTAFTMAGGDYLDPAYSDSVLVNGVEESMGCMITLGLRYLKGNGYISCIESLRKHYVIACGTEGVDYGYSRLKRISTEPFHVVRKAKKGKAVFLAGPKGKIGKLVD